MYYSSHLAVASKLLSTYKPGAPFSTWLKLYFSRNKKHGSKDRKVIAALCYNYFRLGHALKNVPVEERILVASFLCENSSSELLQSLKPKWNEIISKSISEKISVENLQSEIQNIFPFTNELSKKINAENFALSFLRQPKVFLRLRPDRNNSVVQKLRANKIIYQQVSKNCIALANSSKIERFIALEREAVVQDYNSQRIGEFLKPVLADRQGINVWDCCAASGGKSILVYDLNPAIHLTVSDKRESILQNLKERFARAGIKNYQSFVADLTSSTLSHTVKLPDLIIADAPCTGSGTWARSPEQLHYFNAKQIKRYSDLQKQIVENVYRYLEPGGYLLYSTCSVFKQENEEVAEFIKDELHMDLIKKEVFEGYNIQADTMFGALFKRSGSL